MSAKAAAWLVTALPLLTGCQAVLPPLRGEVEVGRDAYSVFVGGEDRASDLYALAADGGGIYQLTYTAVAELAPALSPNGIHVALLRAATLRDSLPGTAWVLDLRSGAERELELPRAAGAPRRVGWAVTGAGGRDDIGNALYLEADSGTYRFDPPAGRTKPRKIGNTERAVAESSFAVLLGDPVFARVVRCDNEPGSLCVAGDSGTPELLAREARDPVRWGADSVGYFVNDLLRVRPLGPGQSRRVDWTNPPRRPRALTFFPGRPTTPPRARP